MDEGSQIRCSHHASRALGEGAEDRAGRFLAIDAGDGLVALKGGKDMLYCAETDSGDIACDRTSIGKAESFRVINAGRGRVALAGGKSNTLCGLDEYSGGITCKRGAIGEGLEANHKLRVKGIKNCWKLGESSSQSCTACQPGTFYQNGGCTACSAGKFSQTEQAAQCTSCVAGKYNALTGQSSGSKCLDCAAGTYSTATGVTSASGCTRCAKGRFSTATAATKANTCEVCPAGKYSDQLGVYAKSKCKS